MFAENRESTNKLSSVTVKPKRFTSRFAVRALWQRAIREQIILNRMDNENKRIQGNTHKKTTPECYSILSKFSTLKALFNNVFTLKNLSCVSLHAISVFGKV